MPSLTSMPDDPQGLLKDGPIMEVHFLIPLELENKLKLEGKPSKGDKDVLIWLKEKNLEPKQVILDLLV